MTRDIARRLREADELLKFGDDLDSIGDLLSEAASLIETMGTEGMVAVPKSALAWLFGEGPDADGYWWSDDVYGEIGKKPFWWRSHFRKLIGPSLVYNKETRTVDTVPMSAAPSAISSSPLPPAGSTSDLVKQLREIIGRYRQPHSMGVSTSFAEWCVIEKAASALEALASPPVPEAPGHADLMVTPESLDAWLDANPPPPVPVGEAADLVSRAEVIRICGELAKIELDYVLEGLPENARTREAAEAMAVRVKFAVAIMPSAAPVSPAPSEALIKDLRGQIEWLERNSILRTPASATIADYLAIRDKGEWETPCPAREDKQHCNCWYDGKACCGCGDEPSPSEPAPNIEEEKD
jgi:hypothetical protein